MIKAFSSALLPALILAACAAPKVHESPGASVLDPASRDVLTGQIPVTDTGMDQISSGNAANTAEQITSLEAGDAITAEQLRTYADRCAPDAAAPAPAEICDELRLMIKRRYKSDDELNRALNVLENLGRGGEADALLLRSGLSDGMLPPEVLQKPAADPAPRPLVKDALPEDVITEVVNGPVPATK